MSYSSEGFQTTQDMSLLRNGIRRRWNISDELRKTCISEVTRVLSTSESTRERIEAVKTIIQMDKINQKDDLAFLPKRHEHVHVTMTNEQLEAKLARLKARRIFAELTEPTAETDIEAVPRDDLALPPRRRT